MTSTNLKKKFGSEFLCKARYRNTLPAPSFAPKLLALPSSQDRYIKYQTTSLEEESVSQRNGLVLDNQFGMPIDLIDMRDYFGETRPTAAATANAAAKALAMGIAPNTTETIDVNEMTMTDRMLMTVPIVAVAANGGSSNLMEHSKQGTVGLTIAPRQRLPAVSWLRRTEYISSETPTGAGKGAGKHERRAAAKEDRSREGQIAAIEKTFERFIKDAPKDATDAEREAAFLASLKHPVNPNITPVESIPVYPDFKIWGNSYTLVTFDVDPEITNVKTPVVPDDDEPSGSRSKKAQRSSNALIKPMHEQNVDTPETWLSYYLPDLPTARRLNKRKRTHRDQNDVAFSDDEDVRASDEEDDNPNHMFSFSLQRDYSYKTIPCAHSSQLAFTFRKATSISSQDQSPAHSVAYYNSMQSKLMLRKKRVKRYDDDEPPVSDIDVRLRRMTEEEVMVKQDAKRDWLL